MESLTISFDLRNHRGPWTLGSRSNSQSDYDCISILQLMLISERAFLMDAFLPCAMLKCSLPTKSLTSGEIPSRLFEAIPRLQVSPCKVWRVSQRSISLFAQRVGRPSVILHLGTLRPNDSDGPRRPRASNLPCPPPVL